MLSADGLRAALIGLVISAIGTLFIAAWIATKAIDSTARAVAPKTEVEF